MEAVILSAVQECNNLGIIGKDITPFLLKRVMQATKGRSLEANLALVKNNAKVGAEIAVKLSTLNSPTTFQPPPIEPSEAPQKINADYDLPVEIMVIGAMAVDLTCTQPNTSITNFPLHTSLPSKMHTSVGGVAHNVALAASYAASGSVRLVTALGADPEGTWLREYADNIGLDVRYISHDSEHETARYVAIHDEAGELVTAAADMSIIENLAERDIQIEIRHGRPRFLAFDGNLSPTGIASVLEEAAKQETKSKFYSFSS